MALSQVTAKLIDLAANIFNVRAWQSSVDGSVAWGSAIEVGGAPVAPNNPVFVSDAASEASLATIATNTAGLATAAGQTTVATTLATIAAAEASGNGYLSTIATGQATANTALALIEAGVQEVEANTAAGATAAGQTAALAQQTAAATGIGTTADAAWSGTGTSSVIALLRALFGLQGAPGTGISAPTGGSGALGFLSGILNALTSGTLKTIGPLPSAAYSNQALITATGTAVQLQNQALQNGVVITALSTNSGPITIGGSTVTSVTNGTGNGYVLMAGASISYAVPNLNALYINGPAGAGVSWTGN